ncbi:MAG: hypothetical protein AB9844_04130 [Clostridiaceae bacterium]
MDASRLKREIYSMPDFVMKALLDEKLLERYSKLNFRSLMENKLPEGV